MIFKTTHRNELGEKLKTIFNFAVQLPKRDEEKLEITPPAYSYLLYFLDQDSPSNSSLFNRRLQRPRLPLTRGVLEQHKAVRKIGI